MTEKLMTLQELDTLLEDTRRLPRVENRAQWHATIALIEIARQLVMLNEKMGVTSAPAKKK